MFSQVEIPKSSQVPLTQQINQNWSDLHAMVNLEVADIRFCNCFKRDAKFLQSSSATSNASMHYLASIQCDLRAKAIKEQTAHTVEVSPDTTMAMAKAALARKSKGKGPPASKPIAVEGTK